MSCAIKSTLAIDNHINSILSSASFFPLGRLRTKSRGARAGSSRAEPLPSPLFSLDRGKGVTRNEQVLDQLMLGELLFFNVARRVQFVGGGGELEASGWGRTGELC